MPGRSSRTISKPSYSYSSCKSPVSIPVTTSSSVNNHNHQVQQPGFFSNMIQGFGLGAGHSIAMNIFRSKPNDTNDTNNNENISKEFVQCMKENNNDKDLCNQIIK